MRSISEDIYQPLLTNNGFTAVDNDHRYCCVGQCWKSNTDHVKGYYWTYGQKDLFGIKIHDFVFPEDTYNEFLWPETYSITYYLSISGEELNPYRRLTSGCVKSFLGGLIPYKVLTHKNVPVQSIGFEIAPAYYDKYLSEAYPGQSLALREAFVCVNQTMDFSEMTDLLLQVYHYRGEGMAAKLFYESKVTEAVSLIIDRWKAKKSQSEPSLSSSDRERLLTVAAYINDHYFSVLPLERLAKIACMGTTKFKSTFKSYYGCTVTEYVQQRRIGHAEHLLNETDLTIGQIAQTVGYTSASRFTELFQKYLGTSPSNFRKASMHL